MADIKISELGAASAVNSTDIFPMTSAGVTIKATAQQIKNYMGVGNLADLSTDDKTNLVAATSEVDSHVDNVQAQVADSDDAYDPTKPYKAGELCIHNDVLYRCITACSAGSWETNQSCFTADTLVKAMSNKVSVITYSRVNSTSPIDVPVGNSEHALLICIGTAADRCALFYIYGSSSGDANVFPINQGASITATGSTNNIRVTSNNSLYSVVRKILLN